jgi:hypothetical protein
MTEETRKEQVEASPPTGDGTEVSRSPPVQEGPVGAVGTDAGGTTKRTRKVLPSVRYLLEHGDPETANRPKTWCEIIGYPVALGLVFAISLLIFHHAPHHLLPPRTAYKIPGYPPMSEREMQGMPPANGPLPEGYMARNKQALLEHKRRLEQKQKDKAQEREL